MAYNEVVEGVQYQSADEAIRYQITTTKWGTAPSSVAVAVFQLGSETNVTALVMPTNAPTVLGDVISLSPLKLLTKGNRYRVEVKFTANTNIFECYFVVRCEF